MKHGGTSRAGRGPTTRRRDGRWRGLRASIVAVSALALIAGCAQIPTSSAVKEVGPISEQDNDLGQVDFLPSGPQTGATQDEILKGFIQAAVSPQGDYSVARDFLTTGFATRWNPDASVTVDTGSDRDYRTLGADQKQLTMTPVAFVDADGSYRRAETSTAIEQEYTFVKQKGQWRISKAPNGVIIDSSRFTNVFAPHSLYFFSPDLAYLVPDERWFPNSPASLQTRIAKELVGGPAKWLDGAYVTAFPQGSQLTSDSVTVSDGVADVDLNTTAGAVDALTLSRMQLQLSESLASVAGISDVRISIAGVQRPVQTAVDPAPIQNPSVDSNALVSRNGKFGLLSGSSVSEIPGVSTKVEALSPRAVTLSADHRAAAVLAAGASWLVSADTDDPKKFDARHGVVAPTLDPSGYAWSGSADAPTDLVVAAPGGTTSTLNAAWPDARSLAGIAMSRDGTRLAALVRTDSGTDIMVAGVVRNAGGKPQSVSTPVDLGPVSAGAATSLTWLDDLTVAALSTTSTGNSSIDLQTVGGESEIEQGPGSGASIGPVGASPYYWVLTSAGSLQWPRGTGWQQRIDDVQLLGQQLGKPD
ncbi:GerMN domain-containing protein [Humibacter albus]|uniref:GerMN domain-containing protein n=1 Tax=Humibacter albus TaxID=427754 RepID=UPI0003B71BEA|nr:GerMN domain-containing protein [Humibacter albus]